MKKSFFEAPPNCACQKKTDPRADPLLSFFQLREACSALKRILAPDWEAFSQFNAGRDDKAPHSYLWTESRNGRLGKITRAVHRFILQGDTVREGVLSGYIAELAEHWTYRPHPLDLHVAVNRYMGKLTELMAADWLTKEGWTIQNLGAWGSPLDIEAASPDAQSWAIEIKHIGQDGEDFSAELSGRPRAPDEEEIDNFIKVRLYDGAKQLAEGGTRKRLCLFIMQPPAFDRYKSRFEKSSLNWFSPVDFSHDEKWNNYLKNMVESRYPDFRSDWRRVIQELDALWIVRTAGGSEYHLEHTLL